MQIIGGLIKRSLFWSEGGLILFGLCEPEIWILQPETPFLVGKGLCSRHMYSIFLFPNGDWMVGCVLVLLFSSCYYSLLLLFIIQGSVSSCHCLVSFSSSVIFIFHSG